MSVRLVMLYVRLLIIKFVYQGGLLNSSCLHDIIITYMNATVGFTCATSLTGFYSATSELCYIISLTLDDVI